MKDQGAWNEVEDEKVKRIKEEKESKETMIILT
jgi:hypothetical protein